MSRFTDRLWREIVREHGAELRGLEQPPAKPTRRPRLLAGTTAGLATVGTALALIFGAASSSPAFAVTHNSDGTFTVSIRRLDGIAGANARLAALGIRARAVPVQVSVGCQQIQPAPNVQRMVQIKPDHGIPVSAAMNLQARLDPKRIPVGRTLVLAAFRAAQRVHILAGRAVAGAVPDCLTGPAPRMAMIHVAPGGCPVPIGPPPNGGTTTTGTGTTTTGTGTTTTGTGTTTTGTTTTGTPTTGTGTNWIGTGPSPQTWMPPGRAGAGSPGPGTTTTDTGTTTTDTTTGTTSTGTGTTTTTGGGTPTTISLAPSPPGTQVTVSPGGGSGTPCRVWTYIGPGNYTDSAMAKAMAAVKAARAADAAAVAKAAKATKAAKAAKAAKH